jgi:hypothetical protein
LDILSSADVFATEYALYIEKHADINPAIAMIIDNVTAIFFFDFAKRLLN